VCLLRVINVIGAIVSISVVIEDRHHWHRGRRKIRPHRYVCHPTYPVPLFRWIVRQRWVIACRLLYNQLSEETWCTIIVTEIDILLCAC
jgi:hypothetical protein